jgi:hypothetical protein
LSSDASGTASFVNDGTLTVNGTLSAQRYLTGSIWHMVSPIAAGGSISTFIQAAGNAVPLTGSNYGMMDYNETTNTWNSYFTASTGGNLPAGKGYGLRRSSDGVVTFTGTLTSGTNTVAVTKAGTEGWNLIGNPFSTSISMNTAANGSNNFLKTNAIDASKLDASYSCIYLWDATTSTYKILGNTSYSGRDLDMNVFAPGQAFFVKAASTGTVEFNKNICVQQTGSIFKAPETIINWPTITLSATGNSTSSSAIITFNANMTNGLDPTYDAGLLRGTNGLSLYTRLLEDNGVDFAVQCLPENYNNLVIPVGIDFEAGGAVTFRADSVQIPAGCSIVLQDKTAGTLTPLTAGSTYPVTLSAETSGTGRFFLKISKVATDQSSIESGTNLRTCCIGRTIFIYGEVGETAMAHLTDMNGRVMGVYSLDKGNIHEIHADGLASGFYLLRIVEGQKSFMDKIVLH